MERYHSARYWQAAQLTQVTLAGSLTAAADAHMYHLHHTDLFQLSWDTYMELKRSETEAITFLKADGARNSDFPR